MVVQMWPYLSNKTQIFKNFLLFFFFPLLLFFLENQTCIICLFLSLNISRSFNTNLSSAQRWRVSKTQHKSATKEEKRGKRQWSRERKSRERKSPIPFHFLYRDRERGSECELPLSVSQASSSAIPSLQCLLNFDVFFAHFLDNFSFYVKGREKKLLQNWWIWSVIWQFFFFFWFSASSFFFLFLS